MASNYMELRTEWDQLRHIADALEDFIMRNLSL